MSPDSSISRTLRGALIAYGVAFLSWLLSQHLPEGDASAWAPGSVQMFFLGLALQAAAWIARWLVTRYEREHGMKGMLTPSIVEITSTLIDGVTVLLFAVATFRSFVWLPPDL